MAHRIKSFSLEEWFNKLEPLAPLALSIHGATLLLFMRGASWRWVAVLAVGLLGIWGLSGWRNFNQAIPLRAAVIWVVTWLLILATGGVSSFFLIWYIILLLVYPFLLAPLPATVLLIGLPLSYLLLIPLSTQPIPLIVIFSRAFLLIFLGGLVRLFGSTIARHVAEHKQTEEALQNSNNRLALAISVTGLGIYDHAVPLDDTTYHSERWAEIIGYEVAELPPPANRLEWVLEQVHPDDHTKLATAYTGFIEGRTEGYHVEIRLKHKSGQWVWVEAYSKAMERNVRGQVTRILGVMQDITERKRAQEALRESEEKFSIAFRASPLILVITTPDGKFIEVNQAFCDLVGYSPEEIIGKTMTELEFLSLQTHEKLVAAAESAGGSLSNAEIQLRVRDGSLRDILYSVETIFLQGVLHCLCTGVDITEYKRAKADVRESETRFRATFEQAAVGIAHVRPDGHWLRVNQKLCDIIGYSREELLERTFQEITHPDDLDLDLENVRQILAGEIETYFLEKRYFRKDGSVIWIILTVSLVRKPSGEPDYLISIIQDITEAKRMEEQYYQAQKMEAVGLLTAGIAHDFNNLLTAINGFAELMQNRFQLEDPLKRMADHILNSGQRAADLVKQLLAFSRKQIIEPRVLNLNTTITDMDKMLRRIISEDIKLETIPNPSLREIKFDPTQLEQVIVNLAVNARDAMPEGGRLTIETANVLLDEGDITYQLEAKPGEYVVMAISDTGLGMSEEVKARIFDPFFTTKEQGKGTGLGLATVYGIVKQHGGYIQVFSELGSGTTFKIYLPSVEEGTALSAPTAVETERPSGNETILLVEDDPEVRNLVQQVLQAQGYTVLEAEEPQKALQLAAQHAGSIHLLLTDVIMPSMNGKLLAENLAQLQPGLKILFMSGYTDDIIGRHGVLEPGVFLLQKPFGATTLARKVRSVLDS